MESFIKGFLKAATASKFLERIRMGLPISLRGHSRRGLKNTRQGQIHRQRPDLMLREFRRIGK